MSTLRVVAYLCAYIVHALAGVLCIHIMYVRVVKHICIYIHTPTFMHACIHVCTRECMYV